MEENDNVITEETVEQAAPTSAVPEAAEAAVPAAPAPKK